ncbi:hypothetical protein KAI87_17045, partial [Myxococcota bacterium]|nr:hypothetical protein [Myxococcota bacterium]
PFIDYYKLDPADPHALEKACGGEAEACAIEPFSVYSPRWAHKHEVAHAVLMRLGMPAPFLSEGLAELLDCGEAHWVGESISRDLVELDTLLAANKIPFEQRAPTAAFVRFLDEEYGREAIRMAYSSLATRLTFDQRSRVFEEVFGISFDDALQIWRDSSEQRLGDICWYAPDGCESGPDLDVASSGRLTLEADLSCIDQTLGTIDVSNNSTFEVVLASDAPNVFFRIRACDQPSDVQRILAFPVDEPYGGPSGIDPAEYIGTEQVLWTTLSPGRYAVTLEVPHLGQAPVGQAFIAMSTDILAFRSLCDATPPVALPANVWSLTTALPPGPLESKYLGFDLASPRDIVLYVPGFYGSTSAAELCDNTCGENCTSLTTPHPVHESAWIRFFNRDSSSSFIRLLLLPPSSEGL